jgi:hypothetical protein
LANSSVPYLKNVFYAQQLDKIVYASGRLGSKDERDLFDGLKQMDGVGGRALRIPKGLLPPLLLVGKAVLAQAERDFSSHEGVRFQHSDATHDFLSNVASLFEIGKGKKLWNAIQKQTGNKEALREVGTLVKEEFEALFGIGLPTSQLSPDKTVITPGTLFSELTAVQTAHVDFKWRKVCDDDYSKGAGAIGFLPLGPAGMLLLFWTKGRHEVEKESSFLFRLECYSYSRCIASMLAGLQFAAMPRKRKAIPKCTFTFEMGISAMIRLLIIVFLTAFRLRV